MLKTKKGFLKDGNMPFILKGKGYDTYWEKVFHGWLFTQRSNAVSKSFKKLYQLYFATCSRNCFVFATSCVCVCARARFCLVAIFQEALKTLGNVGNLTGSSETWENIINTLKLDEEMYTSSMRRRCCTVFAARVWPPYLTVTPVPRNINTGMEANGDGHSEGH